MASPFPRADQRITTPSLPFARPLMALDNVLLEVLPGASSVQWNIWRGHRRAATPA